MIFGVDYYPEHWPEERWAHDLDEMVALGFNTIRIGEFAWSRFEPADGEYDFAWTDKVAELCAERNITIMLGLPVRNPPAWLFARHPDMAIRAHDGHRESYGSRYTVCLNHAELRRYALRLTRAIGERYAGSDAIASWHLDNEFGDGSICYCERCRQAFISWLQDRYGSVEKVNEAWGLVFWSLEISDWDQVWVPARINRFPHNPSLLHDYRRFVSDTTAGFVREQGDVLRRAAPGAIITTNLQSMTRYHTDYYKMCEPLDVAAVNYYPPSSYVSADLDIVRGTKQAPFWVVEQRSGPQGFTHRAFPTPQPGETRMYTYQSIAHGADAVLYFRWRATPFGQEQFHGSVLRHDGSRTRFAEEIAQVGAELHELGPELNGSVVRNDVAMIMSYESRWALDDFRPHPSLEYRDLFLRFHGGLERRQIGADVVHPEADLRSYKVVLVPMLYVLSTGALENIAAFVAGGGTVVVTCQSGVKDENANILAPELAARLNELLGVRVTESIALADGERRSMKLLDGDSYECEYWVDIAEPTSAEVLATMGGDWYEGAPALTRNEYGEGQAFYIASIPEARFYDSVVARVVEDAGVSRVLAAGPEIEAVRRVTESASYVFVLNRSDRRRAVRVPAQYETLLSDAGEAGPIDGVTLEPFGVAVLRGE